MTIYEALIFSFSMCALIAIFAAVMVIAFFAGFVLIGCIVVTINLPLRFFDHTASRDELVAEIVIASVFISSTACAAYYL